MSTIEIEQCELHLPNGDVLPLATVKAIETPLKISGGITRDRFIDCQPLSLLIDLIDGTTIEVTESGFVQCKSKND